MFKKYDYDFNLIKRVGNIAIYTQSKKGKIYAYEVHKIRIQKEHEIMINNQKALFKEMELLASAEYFGIYGWSFTNIQAALDKMGELRIKG